MSKPQLAGVTLPCLTCGAALHVEVETRSVQCDFCQRGRSVSGAEIERVRGHFRTLTVLRDAGDAANRAAIDARETAKRRVAYSFGVPIIVALFLLISLAGPYLLPHRYLSIMPFTTYGVIALVYAGIFVIMRVGRQRARRFELPRFVLERADCQQCGAQVPIAVGATMHCPFCSATLLPNIGAAANVETVAQVAVHARASLAAREQAETAAQYAEVIQRSTNSTKWMSWAWMGVIMGGGLLGVVVMKVMMHFGATMMQAEIVDVSMIACLIVGFFVAYTVWLNKKRR